MRLEKSFGIWNAEFMQAYTAVETGLSRWIDFGKPDFIGRDAALRERKRGSERTLATLEIDATDADASGYEPVWREGRRVGFVTSGGYGHTLRKSIALALVASEFATPGTSLSCHVVGEERPAVVIPHSPYDPKGKSMRA